MGVKPLHLSWAHEARKEKQEGSIVQESMGPAAQDLRKACGEKKVGEAAGEVKVKGTSGMRLIHTARCPAHSAALSVFQEHSLLSAHSAATSVFQEHSLLSAPSLSKPCEKFTSSGLLWRLLGRQNLYLYT